MHSSRALSRVWKAVRFSLWTTQQLHSFPDTSPFDARIRAAKLGYRLTSTSAQMSLAENYVGLPLR